MDSSSTSREREVAAGRKEEEPRAARRGAGKRAREGAAEQKEGDHGRQRTAAGGRETRNLQAS